MVARFFSRMLRRQPQQPGGPGIDPDAGSPPGVESVQEDLPAPQDIPTTSLGVPRLAQRVLSRRAARQPGSGLGAALVPSRGRELLRQIQRSYLPGSGMRRRIGLLGDARGWLRPALEGWDTYSPAWRKRPQPSSEEPGADYPEYITSGEGGAGVGRSGDAPRSFPRSGPVRRGFPTSAFKPTTSPVGMARTLARPPASSRPAIGTRQQPLDTSKRRSVGRPKTSEMPFAWFQRTAQPGTRRSPLPRAASRPLSGPDRWRQSPQQEQHADVWPGLASPSEPQFGDSRDEPQPGFRFREVVPPPTPELREAAGSPERTARGQRGEAGPVLPPSGPGVESGVQRAAAESGGKGILQRGRRLVTQAREMVWRSMDASRKEAGDTAPGKRPPSEPELARRESAAHPAPEPGQRGTAASRPAALPLQVASRPQVGSDKPGPAEQQQTARSTPGQTGQPRPPSPAMSAGAESPRTPSDAGPPGPGRSVGIPVRRAARTLRKPSEFLARATHAGQGSPDAPIALLLRAPHEGRKGFARAGAAAQPLSSPEKWRAAPGQGEPSNLAFSPGIPTSAPASETGSQPPSEYRFRGAISPPATPAARVEGGLSASDAVPGTGDGETPSLAGAGPDTPAQRGPAGSAGTGILQRGRWLASRARELVWRGRDTPRRGAAEAPSVTEAQPGPESARRGITAGIPVDRGPPAAGQQPESSPGRSGASSPQGVLGALRKPPEFPGRHSPTGQRPGRTPFTMFKRAQERRPASFPLSAAAGQSPGGGEKWRSAPQRQGHNDVEPDLRDFASHPGGGSQVRPPSYASDTLQLPTAPATGPGRSNERGASALQRGRRLAAQVSELALWGRAAEGRGAREAESGTGPQSETVPDQRTSHVPETPGVSPGHRGPSSVLVYRTVSGGDNDTPQSDYPRPVPSRQAVAAAGRSAQELPPNSGLTPLTSLQVGLSLPVVRKPLHRPTGITPTSQRVGRQLEEKPLAAGQASRPVGIARAATPAQRRPLGQGHQPGTGDGEANFLEMLYAPASGAGRPDLPLAHSVQRQFPSPSGANREFANGAGSAARPAPASDRQLGSRQGGPLRQGSPSPAQSHTVARQFAPVGAQRLAPVLNGTGIDNGPPMETAAAGAFTATPPAGTDGAGSTSGDRRTFKAEEIEFLASKVYSYLKDKLAMERERHGRPGYRLWS